MNDKAIEAAARAVCKVAYHKPEECDCERNKTGSCAEHIDVASAAIAAYEAARKSGQRKWRHKKRGTTYRIVGQALVQAAQPVKEGDAMTIYQGEHGDLWARPVVEFSDGRFESLPLPSPPESK